MGRVLQVIVVVSAIAALSYVRYIHEDSSKADLDQTAASLSEAVRAANGFRLTGDPYFSRHFDDQIAAAEQSLRRYLSENNWEVEKAKALYRRWDKAKIDGAAMCRSTKEAWKSQSEFRALAGRAKERINSQIQVLSATDSRRAEKQQALRAIKSGIWSETEAIVAHGDECLHALVSRDAPIPCKTLRVNSSADVDDLLINYKKLINAPNELTLFDELKRIRAAMILLKRSVFHYRERARKQYGAMYEAICQLEESMGLSTRTRPSGHMYVQLVETQWLNEPSQERTLTYLGELDALPRRNDLRAGGDADHRHTIKRSGSHLPQ